MSDSRDILRDQFNKALVLYIVQWTDVMLYLVDFECTHHISDFMLYFNRVGDIFYLRNKEKLRKRLE